MLMYPTFEGVFSLFHGKKYIYLVSVHFRVCTKMSIYVKFMFSKKATQTDQIFSVDLAFTI